MSNKKRKPKNVAETTPPARTETQQDTFQAQFDAIQTRVKQQDSLSEQEIKKLVQDIEDLLKKLRGVNARKRTVYKKLEDNLYLFLSQLKKRPRIFQW